LHCFNYPATLSHGKVSGDIPAISDGADRLARNIVRRIFVEDREIHFENLKAFATPEIIGDEWTDADPVTSPVTALATGFVGAYSRYVRSAMLVSLSTPWAIAARAKGISDRRLTFNHALRNSLVPFVNVLALDFGAIFGASLAVDFVFAQHGLASFLVQGLFNSDPYEVEPVVVIAAGIVLLSRALADVTTARLDPRAHLA